MPDDDELDLSGRSILVIEDERYSSNAIVRVLKGLGALDVAVAVNGVEALAQIDAAEPEPDLLFVDIVMPDMGGVELLQTLAERAYGGDVVIFSGSEDSNMKALKRVAQFRGLNVLGYIAKPVTRAALAEILRRP